MRLPMCARRLAPGNLSDNHGMSRISHSAHADTRAHDPAAAGDHAPRRHMLRWTWRRGKPTTGNAVRLLHGGQDFFPALIAAIDQAAFQVMLETYIYADDEVGRAVSDALIRAAARGVTVRVTVDGFGAGDMPAELAARLRAGGVQLRVFRMLRGFRLARRHLRRLHRKLAVIDRRVAFVGGINIIDDHNHGPFEGANLGPRYDFAVQVGGPLVDGIALSAERLWWRLSLRDMHGTERAAAVADYPLVTDLPPRPEAAGGVRAALLLRDNLRNRRTIEREYLRALGAARHDVILANAYFLPGHKMRRALLACRARGVRVRLLLQGRVEYRLQHYATHALYASLLEAGVEIYEYAESFLHAKVGVVDEAWATVGSSNMDPFSLLLAREANVAVYDAAFAAELRTALEYAIAHRSVRVMPEVHARRSPLHRLANWAAYMLLRLGVVIAGVAGRY
ncbi:Phosphatidylserine/phosphatidylglycerophosphate cardiolipin synthase or related enzyme [Cupriavidus necator H16]|uniref:Cardiolipin synthase B n=2 Tax=Cupriavidus necator (strain ATCC 17699 / DSM 428 / KCTC 22496 / NCIMB 10442 / H16 / Stanier 337) TaxID=381666 RepID=Q0KEG3_CUPNH|nr:Phosphatidylserine/phosphatidylglycerophosphate cardiolipin synthase or related enzyme [Cupriavidus necator H16]